MNSKIVMIAGDAYRAESIIQIIHYPKDGMFQVYSEAEWIEYDSQKGKGYDEAVKAWKVAMGDMPALPEVPPPKP